MKQCLLFLILLWTAFPLPAIAHHPAADIVDEEIYAMISEMVADTPHATLTFDDDMGDGSNTIVIETETVSTIEALIHEGLLAQVSLLDGEVSVAIEFLEDMAIGTSALRRPSTGQDQANSYYKYEKWSAWGGPVRITVQQNVSSD